MAKKNWYTREPKQSSDLRAVGGTHRRFDGKPWLLRSRGYKRYGYTKRHAQITQARLKRTFGKARIVVTKDFYLVYTPR